MAADSQLSMQKKKPADKHETTDRFMKKVIYDIHN